MKWVFKILILNILFFNNGISLGQPILNERYIIDDATFSIFGSVIATDSCYYVSGMHTNTPSLLGRKGSFLKFNLDGSINTLTVIENDTLGIDMWQGYNLIQTLDDNFACVAVADGTSEVTGFLFVKLAPNGDTLITKYFNDFYDDTHLIGLNPATLIQVPDSSYFGTLSVFREDNLMGGTIFYKLDKQGTLLFHKIFYGIGASYYRVLKDDSLLKYDNSTFIIGSILLHTSPSPEEERHHMKLILVDTLGEIIEEHTYWDDLLALDCNSLTKTADGGLLYCGRYGKYFPEDGVIGYKARIVKLNTDFTEAWEIEVGNFTSFAWVGLFSILQVNETEYVAVGNRTGEVGRAGLLVKFNIYGEKLWERQYKKIPLFEGEFNFPDHVLYDVALTPDEGFVMVGQGINYYDDNDELPGQKAWLVKTDKYGCLVPNCQYIGVETEPIDTTDTTDTTIVIPPTPPVTWLFPNPAHEFLFYYHQQDNFQPATATIYSTSGQLVQKWEITENDVTYEIDVSQFAAGTYLLKVANHLGETIRTERFVKI
ncbi:MAG: T9SS type A sorting domain-containing protein [Crocinitomix sp.]|nr:T9SS type A sorting domain-containing protein [Crocinitomix sp.]